MAALCASCDFFFFASYTVANFEPVACTWILYMKKL
jgi:hypothetical protein